MVHTEMYAKWGQTDIKTPNGWDGQDDFNREDAMLTPSFTFSLMTTEHKVNPQFIANMESVSTHTRSERLTLVNAL